MGLKLQLSSADTLSGLVGSVFRIKLVDNQMWWLVVTFLDAEAEQSDRPTGTSVGLLVRLVSPPPGLWLDPDLQVWLLLNAVFLLLSKHQLNCRMRGKWS